MRAVLVRAVLGVLLVGLVLAGIARAAVTDGDGFQVIVNPDNPLVTVDHGFLRDIYLKRATEWQTGAPVRPLDLSTRFPARVRFTREVLRKTSPQLRTYWNQQIFSGKGVPPPEADSTSAVIAYVLDNPGAIAYVPANANPGRAKVIKVQY